MVHLLEPYKGKNIQGDEHGGAGQIFPKVRNRGKNNRFALADGSTLIRPLPVIHAKTLKERLPITSNRV